MNCYSAAICFYEIFKNVNSSTEESTNSKLLFCGQDIITQMHAVSPTAAKQRGIVHPLVYYSGVYRNRPKPLTCCGYFGNPNF